MKNEIIEPFKFIIENGEIIPKEEEGGVFFSWENSEDMKEKKKFQEVAQRINFAWKIVNKLDLEDKNLIEEINSKSGANLLALVWHMQRISKELQDPDRLDQLSNIVFLLVGQKIDFTKEIEILEDESAKEETADNQEQNIPGVEPITEGNIDYRENDNPFIKKKYPYVPLLRILNPNIGLFTTFFIDNYNSYIGCSHANDNNIIIITENHIYNYIGDRINKHNTNITILNKIKCKFNRVTKSPSITLDNPVSYLMELINDNPMQYTILIVNNLFQKIYPIFNHDDNILIINKETSIDCLDNNTKMCHSINTQVNLLIESFIQRTPGLEQ